jgi:hypothetical protein
MKIHECGGVAPRILTLRSRWTWMMRFTSPSIYPRKQPMVLCTGSYDGHRASLNTKFSPSRPRRHTGGVKVKLHSFLTLALDAGEWSNLLPAALPLGKSPGAYCIRDWVGPKAWLGVLEHPYVNRTTIRRSSSPRPILTPA